METRIARARWTRVCLAAIRLAALYAVGAFALVVLLGTLVLDPPLLSDLADLAVPFGIIFLLACVVLAVARRAGFAALWILLATTWLWMLRDGGVLIVVPRIFLAWSVLAWPLFAIGVLGSSGTEAGRPRLMRAARPLVVLTVWVLIAGIALHSTLGTADVHFMEAADPFVAAFSRFVWIPAPFVIAGIEIVRMWLATSPARPR